MNEVAKQREFYRQMAHTYDKNWAFDREDEHFIASAILSGLLSHYNVSTLLDIGCGTGRTLIYLKGRNPTIDMYGLEPVSQLREEAIRKGVDRVRLLDGDACKLHFPDNSFDCVSLFGVLHHIRDPKLAIREASRVARKVLFVSDHNIYGMGSTVSKIVKQSFRDLGLRSLLRLLLTKGKGYNDTTWDGVFYPFSLVDHFAEFHNNTKSVYTFCTKTSAINLYRDASHFAVLAVKGDVRPKVESVVTG